MSIQYVVKAKVHHIDLLPVNDNAAGASKDGFLLNTLKTFLDYPE